MQIIEQPHTIIETGIVAGIGFFDGVHSGHRSLISNIISTAQSRDMSSAVITFRNHPREVLHSDYCPQLINTFEEKSIIFLKPDWIIVLFSTLRLKCLKCPHLNLLNF